MSLACVRACKCWLRFTLFSFERRHRHHHRHRHRHSTHTHTYTRFFRFVIRHSQSHNNSIYFFCRRRSYFSSSSYVVVRRRYLAARLFLCPIFYYIFYYAKNHQISAGFDNVTIKKWQQKPFYTGVLSTTTMTTAKLHAKFVASRVRARILLAAAELLMTSVTATAWYPLPVHLEHNDENETTMMMEFPFSIGTERRRCLLRRILLFMIRRKFMRSRIRNNGNANTRIECEMKNEHENESEKGK